MQKDLLIIVKSQLFFWEQRDKKQGLHVKLNQFILFFYLEVANFKKLGVVNTVR